MKNKIIYFLLALLLLTEKASGAPSDDSDEICEDVSLEDQEYVSSTTSKSIDNGCIGKCTSFAVPTYLRHTDCAKFCQCTSSGRTVVQTCPTVLRWNAELETCDWPMNVRCSVN